jgi:hypothetical protein
VDNVALEIADSLDNDHWYGSFSWRRLFVRLAVLYVVAAFLCWQEVRYHTSAVALTGEVEFARSAPEGRLQVRYHFADPVTGARRQNTVIVPESLRPAGATVPIQVIPGRLSSSRLAAQARPGFVTAFAVANAVLLLAGLGVIAAWAREAKPRRLNREQRAAAAYERLGRRMRERSHSAH